MTEVLMAALVVVVALGLSAAVGYPVTVLVLRNVETTMPPRTGNAGSAADLEADPAGSGQEAGSALGAGCNAGQARAELHPAQVLRGGTWIGILERLAITGAILVSYPAAIAVVIAVKGLGRFPELRAATGVSERFIVGTLTSALWAAGIGVGALGALNALG